MSKRPHGTKRPQAYTWDRVSEKGDHENLIACLAAMINIIGHEVTLSPAHLAAIDGKIGLRARYEDNGGITLWTYDLVEDIKGITSGPETGGSN